ncbi:lipopolysaccharide biosynthesis protein [Actinoplanes sp. RD1]|uniref:lipopolysaccharide biosynthesis protein n=1 Tax=Actinoplanes sp. RD1 TaxID=3064538 RepID=UPI002740FD90|nr:polysaccharide biosynthesis C-terminal domain-containing protein [Actinoplanes sp. RD1]
MMNLTGRRSAAGGGVVLILRFGLGAVLNYGFGVALAWLLTPAEFGAVSVLQNVQFLCAMVLSAGFPWVLAATIAKEPDHRVVAATYRAAFLGNIVLGAGLAAAFAAAQLSLTVVPAASAVTVACVTAMIAVLGLTSALGGGLQGERRFDGYGVMQISEIAVKVAVSVLVVGVLGLGVGGVAVSFLTGAVLSALIGVRALADRLPGRGPVAWRRTGARAVSVGLASSAFGAVLAVDVIALSVLGQGHGVTAADVALYQAAMVLARAPFFVGDALSNAVFPFIAGARGRDEVDGWFRAAFRWLPLALLPVQIVLIVAPGPVLGALFPPHYAQAAGVLRWLTVGTVGLIAMDVLLKTLNAREVGAVARWVPVALAAEVLALVVLVPRWGVTGAAVAFVAGTWAGAAALARIYLREYRPQWFDRRTVLRYLLALVPLGGLLAVADAASPLLALAAIGAGLVLYAVAVVRLRLLRDDDIVRVRRLLRRHRVVRP